MLEAAKTDSEILVVEELLFGIWDEEDPYWIEVLKKNPRLVLLRISFSEPGRLKETSWRGDGLVHGDTDISGRYLIF